MHNGGHSLILVCDSGYFPLFHDFVDVLMYWPLPGSLSINLFANLFLEQRKRNLLPLD